jgi:hypothetical protein
MLFGDNVCDKIDSLTKGQKAAALVTGSDQGSGSSRFRGRRGTIFKIILSEVIVLHLFIKNIIRPAINSDSFISFKEALSYSQ